VRARGTSRRRGTVALAVAGAGLVACVAIGVESVLEGIGTPGGVTLAVGTVAALSGAYLSLCLLVLVSRVPWLERELGHVRMVALHRTVAPYALLLILAHVVLTTLSYAQAAETSFVGQLWNLVTRSAWMMPALAAFVIMMGVGALSYRRIRARMSHETWWVAHLYFYLAVALSFGHQVALGPMFVSNQAQRWFWTSLYVLVAGVIVVSRVLMPLTLSLRHRLHVISVVPESGGAVSVYLGGRDLDLLKARGGQFFQWRFLTRHWWWQAHPYSLSAAPNGSWLRITVKGVGDQSRMLRRLTPGTRVWAEGPYGVVTAAARHGEHITAVAAGIGITAIRALLDDLPASADVTVVYRVSDATTATLRAELDAVAAARRWRVHYLEGPRSLHPVTPALLFSVAPGIAASDVYVCGPAEFADAVVRAATRIGVEGGRIHRESFSL
jgi:predicted ferric reductase